MIVAGLPLARLRDDRRGVALIEFAFVLPFLLLLFVGGYQLSDGVFAYRKVTSAARTVADLTSQYTSVTDGDLDTILNASQQVMTPYKVANATLVVSQVTINSTGDATVSWSRGKNVSGYTTGVWFYVPTAYKQSNTTIIVADVTYKYVPIFASSLIGTITMKEQVTMFPRKSTTITKS